MQEKKQLILLNSFLKKNFNAIFRASNDSFLVMHVLFGIFCCNHVIPKQQLGQCEFEFKHGKSHAHTNTWSQAKRQIGQWISFLLVTLRIKFVRTHWAPIIRIVMQTENISCKYHSDWYVKVFYFGWRHASSSHNSSNKIRAI